MAIDTLTEDLIAFRDAVRAFPGREVCLQTLHRWRLDGVRGVKLDTCLVGGLRYTSREAINRFIVAQNRGENAAESPQITPKQRAKQSAAARQALKDAGIKLE